MTSRNKIYAVIIGILVMLYTLRFVEIDGFIVPTRGRINDQKQNLKQLRAELANQEKLNRKREEKRQKISSITDSYWPWSGKIPTNDIQQNIERLGQKTGVILDKVGAPKIVEVSDKIRAVDITVSSTTTIKDLGRFLQEISNHQPRLTWNNCIMRPNRTKEPTAVTMSGTIRTYLLAEPAIEYIEGAPLL